MKVRELFAEYWAERLEVNPIGNSTKACEESFYVDYIDPVIGRMDCEKVTVDDILMIATRARSCGRLNGTLVRIRRILEWMFSYGLRKGKTENNVMEYVTERYNQLIRESIYSEEDRKRIMACFERMSLGNLYGFVASMGCTGEEAKALQEDSVMLDEGVCYLDYVMKNDENNNPKFVQKSGVTWRQMTERAKGYLTKQFRVQALNKRRAGEKWNNPRNLVFTDNFGNPLTKELIRKENERLIKLSGIPMLSLERLRSVFNDLPGIEEYEGHDREEDRSNDVI